MVIHGWLSSSRENHSGASRQPQDCCLVEARIPMLFRTRGSVLRGPEKPEHWVKHSATTYESRAPPNVNSRHALDDDIKFFGGASRE
jgi:hypothetical protein